ncbi:hypothetical protein V3C99_016520 [Haemonchus contortus]
MESFGITYLMSISYCCPAPDSYRFLLKFY